VGLSTATSGAQYLCLKVTSAGDVWNLDWFQLITTDNANGSGGNQTSGNLLVNPGFESGITGWQGYFLNGGAVLQEGVASAGSFGGKMRIDAGAGTSWHSQLFQVFTTQGTSYTLSVKARNAEAGSKPFEVFCEQNGGAFTAYGTTACTATDGAWTTCSVTCTTPVGMGTKFGVKAGGNAMDLRVDEASLIKN
jgi:hypothetical protein